MDSGSDAFSVALGKPDLRITGQELAGQWISGIRKKTVKLLFVVTWAGGGKLMIMDRRLIQGGVSLEW